MHVTSLENVPLVQTSLDTFIHEVFSRLEHDLLVVLLLLNSPNWFRSYVSERKHYVLIDDQKSIETSLYFGVPQGGSVQLGSVLFILYTTPLTGLVKKHYYSS